MTRSDTASKKGLCSQKTAPPLVSIIIPTDGRRCSSLTKSVESCLNQSYIHIEVVVVTDGDLSKTLCGDFNERFPQVCVLSGPRSYDPGPLRNFGARSCRGDYIVFLDDDDLLYKNHVEILLANKKPGTIPFSKSKYRIVEKAGERLVNSPEPDNHSAKYYDTTAIFEQNIAPINNFLIGRDEFMALGGFDESLVRLEDWDLWARAAITYKFVFVGEFTSEIVVDKKKPSRTYTAGIFDSIGPQTGDFIKKRLEQLKAGNKFSMNDVNELNLQAPIVSVVMPCYNDEKHLAEALKSILNQTFRSFEVILINDGSTDGTEAVIKSHLEDTRIRYFKRSNHGVTASLNFGLSKALGKYIARMDADDVAMPERLEKQVQYLNTHPECGLLGTRFTAVNESLEFIEHCDVETENHELQEELLKSCRFGHPTCMYRRVAIEKVGPYYENWLTHTAEDYDLWLRISEEFKVANLPERLLLYRVHENSVTKSKRRQNERATKNCIRRAHFRRKFKNVKTYLKNSFSS